jgi:LacI family transcriptional regulator
MPTIKDVADVAQVSITTVSHVINGTRYVSDELRARVEEAMTTLSYHPNGLARSLRVGQTKTIGLIVPDNSNLYFAEIARIIEDLGYQNGYSVILCNTDDMLEKETSYLDVLVNKMIDGIIFISAGDSGENFHRLHSQNIPIVIADREFPDIAADLVLLDNCTGGYLATRYLIGMGHRRIACISGSSLLTPSAQRVDGYRQAMREAGLEIAPNTILPGDFRFQSGEACMDQLLESTVERPTAVFVCNDMMAMGAIRSVRKHGLQLPADISIVGFDNILLAQAFFPALTTVAQPIQEMAETAVRLLIRQIQRKADPRSPAEYQRIVLKPVLIERDSCCPPLN